MTRLPVVILAGGLATRLGALAVDTPKILLDVAGRPFAEHQIAFLKREGVSRVVYCLGYQGYKVRTALGDGQQWGMHFEFVHDGPSPAGTGGAIRHALPHVGDAFFSMYGDSYLDCSLAEVERAFRASGQPALMTVFKNDSRWDTSNVRFEAGRILAYDKSHPTPLMRHIDYGCSILTPGVFDPYPADQPLDLAQVLGDLVGQHRLAGFEVHQRFYEIGSLSGLEETRAFLAARNDADHELQ